MKIFKIAGLLIMLSFFSFSAVHKYYISNAKVEYVKAQKSVQIILRVYIDDIENLLRTRYNENITLTGKNEPKEVDAYLEKYLKEKIKIKINNKAVNINFIGKEYEDYLLKSYLEITDVNNIKTFEISNQILYDLFSEQQNIIKININSKQKSIIQTQDNKTTLLNFDE